MNLLITTNQRQFIMPVSSIPTQNRNGKGRNITGLLPKPINLRKKEEILSYEFTQYESIEELNEELE
ncbi:MAG: hypothetical protein ACRCVJ_12030 [Clostridium sp.]|uniref:hypothetical protein n=1 Tax=Clostridium sp. TaxID=1506 RepID=UPI003F2F4D4D